MLPPELKKEWLAKWRRILDNNASRMDNLDELADAAYWHAVEELVTTPVG